MSIKPCHNNHCFHVKCYNKSLEYFHLNSKDETCMCRLCSYIISRCENCKSGIFKNLLNEPKGTCMYCKNEYDYSNDTLDTKHIATEEDKLNHINYIIRFMYENICVNDNDPPTNHYICELEKLGVKLMFKYKNNYLSY